MNGIDVIRRTMGCFVTGAVLCAASITSTASGIVIYVDDDAPAHGDGLTWNTAYRFLQDALDFAWETSNNVTEIRVGQGTYKPDQSEANSDGTGNSMASFTIPSVPLRGGFAGIGAANPDARDIESFSSILSGDLAGDDLTNSPHHTDNSRVILHNESDDAIEVDGVTILGARHTGIFLQDTQGTFRNCTVKSNRRFGLLILGRAAYIEDSLVSNNGRGITCSTAELYLDHSTFIENFDGAVRIGSQAYLEASSSQFENNSSQTGGALVIDGGGDYASGAVERCTFISNHAAHGGAVALGTEALWSAVNCTFIDNSADTSGGAFSAPEQLSHGSDAVDHAYFKNCVFFRNSAGQNGGAISANISTVKSTNCTFARNAAPVGGAIYNGINAKLTVYNSIISSNPGGSFAGAGPRVVRYSDIAGGAPGAGNLNINPQFVNLLHGDLRLRPSSVCIDSGNNSYLLPTIITDLAGKPRLVNDPATSDTGLGDRPIVDMGAYEFQRP